MDKREYKAVGKKKVLLVEDVEMNQFLAKCIMESWDFEVDIANNGFEALGRLEKSLYDIILMDIQMPEMDGIESARRIRALPDPVKSSIPIIALTANAMQDERNIYADAGMNDCLAKPFAEKNLFEIIRKHLPATEMPVPEPEETDTDPQVKTYNLSLLHSLSGGDKDFVRRMLTLFLETMPVSMKEMLAANEKGDWISVGNLAHKMKSIIDSMAITGAKNLIRELENNGRHQINTELIPDQVNLVIKELDQCMAEVKADFGL